jgi:hypothetical protein
MDSSNTFLKQGYHERVYMLIKLSLFLPVAIIIVERVFTAMHIVKSRLWNRMIDKWMNDSLVVYIKKDIFEKIHNEVVSKYKNSKITIIK